MSQTVHEAPLENANVTPLLHEETMQNMEKQLNLWVRELTTSNGRWTAWL